jgi:hypothetical protein
MKNSTVRYRPVSTNFARFRPPAGFISRQRRNLRERPYAPGRGRSQTTAFGPWAVRKGGGWTAPQLGQRTKPTFGLKEIFGTAAGQPKRKSGGTGFLVWRSEAAGELPRRQLLKAMWRQVGRYPQPASGANVSARCANASCGERRYTRDPEPLLRCCT